MHERWKLRGRGNGRAAMLVLLALLGITGCDRSSAPLTAAVEGTASTDALAAAGPSYAETDFPVWRNVDQDGVEEERDVPVRWSTGDGVLWSADVPGKGHSSPVVCGDRVFLTTADDSAATQSVLAYDRGTGKRLWQTTVHTGNLPRKHGKNSHASATPACDGENVYSAFINDGALHVTAVDREGEIVWRREVGPFESEHGYGSSVVLWKGLVFVNGDSRGNGYLAALDRASGDLVWRTPRRGPGRHGSYATPLVAELAGRDQLVLAGYGRVVSYDPRTGEELWRCDGPAEVMANTPAARDPVVIVSGGYPEKEILCIDAGGRGDVTGSGVKWRADRHVAYVPSPTVIGDTLVSVADDGILGCYSLSDGELRWRERLGGDFSASPLVVGNRFYLPNESGTVLVFEVDPEFDLLAENRLDDDGGMASLAVSGDRLFVRTANRVYCLGDE